MQSSSSTSTDPITPNLLALVVGVGAYQRVRPLKGSVNDAKAVAEYISGLPTFSVDIRLLTDEQASKAAITDGFLTYLSQAKATDTVLFYFAGHGVQEEADQSLWLQEADGMLECLVCHDANTTNTWDFLLTDKELRYLIAKVSNTGAHIVTLFDCCHSGDNTRASDLLTEALTGQDVRERRLPQAAPRRPYEAFCFQDVISADQLTKEGIDTVLPEGHHVQISACESDQTALEVNGAGVFTQNLLGVLTASHGQITYGDLHNRVRQYMRFAYEQCPRVYVPDLTETGSGASQSMHIGFLNQSIDPDTLMASASFNASKGWLLDVGAIHGLVDGATIHLLDADNTALPATAAQIGPDYTVLDVMEAVGGQLNPNMVYRAEVNGLLSKPIHLHMVNHGGPNNDLTTLLNASGGSNQRIALPEDDETKADYTLRTNHGLYYLTYPASTDPINQYRPLVRPILADDPAALTSLTDHLRHLAKWQYLRHLRNPAVAQPILDVTLMPNGQPALGLRDAHGPAIPITYQHNQNGWSTTLSISLKNPTDQPLYCTALYLSRDFMSFTGFLPPNYRLEAGADVTLRLPDKKMPSGRQTSFRLRLEDVIRQYNWPSATEYIKLLITTEPVSEKTLAFLALEALPSPIVLADLVTHGEKRGGIAIDDDEAAEPLPAWSTQTIALQLINPLYNTVQADELDQMLALPTDVQQDDIMADFALGLYFQPDTTSAQPTLKLRDGIRVVLPDEGQRGLWTDIKLALANSVARRIQNRQYRQNLVRYPDRMRIVAEGDSWFQYPFLLRDIIDYLSGVWSVYSVAAAGATLDDYLKNSEFLEAIAQVKPTYFLLSGGGNDLLGDGFTDLISPQPDLTKTGAERYLTNAFDKTLAAMTDRYRRILRLVHLGYPQVRVLVHGYDYVIPSGSEKLPGSTSWMGEVLTSRGVLDQQEREQIGRYLIDAFNEQLKGIAAEYPNVTYLDLRGAVRRTDRLADYWYDEIHPNDKGFLSLSSRFVAEINKSKTPSTTAVTA